MKHVLKLLLLLIAIHSFAQQPAFKQLDEFVNILNNNDKLMGTMTVSKSGNTVYKTAVGFSDLDSKTSNTEQSKFRIGSITKAFTAVMIFQLIDEGKLTLKTPLSTFFPEVPKASEITIANLLNHSSGLFNITNANDIGEWIFKPSSQKQMLSRIVNYKSDFNPGDKTEYSNTNYILLGYIAELLDKKSYAQILKDRIVNKIELKDTYYGGTIALANNECISYTKVNDSWKKQEETDMSNPAGAGAIVSTSKDLATFFNALFSGALMSENSFENMKKTNDNETCHGLFYANMDGLDIYASEGGIDGFQSMLVHIPATQTTIALTANALDFSKMRIMLSALAVSHGKPIMLPKFTKIELTEAEAKQYEGEYACDQVPYKLIFKAKGNVLMGAPEQSNLRELTPIKQHQFSLEALGVTLEFYPETGVLRFTQANNETLLFKKL